MRNELETTTIARAVELCEDSGDLQEILQKYDGYYLSWQSCINRLLDESGLSYIRMAQKCGISKNTLKKWCCEGGAPRSRNTFLKIGFGLGMNAVEVSRMLTRYGGYHGLYAKDLFDAVCLYALEKRCAGDEGYTYRYAERLYERCLAVQSGSGWDSHAWTGADASPQVDSSEDSWVVMSDAAGTMELPFLKTEIAMEQIYAMDTEADFLRFSASNSDLLKGRGTKLAAFLKDYLKAKAPERFLEDREESLRVSAVFSALGIPKRFEKIWSVLTVHGVIPRREQLVALALHLEMTPEELNQLLGLSGMEELCAKDRLECVIIYALQQMCLLHPEITFSNAIELLGVTKDEKQKRRCRSIVEEYTLNCYQCSKEDAGTVAGYVKELLLSLDLEEAEELLELI